MDPTLLLDLVKMQMPYGKYKGYLICNIPESYLLWYKDKGFPERQTGRFNGYHVRDKGEWIGISVNAIEESESVSKNDRFMRTFIPGYCLPEPKSDGGRYRGIVIPNLIGNRNALVGSEVALRFPPARERRPF